MWLRIEQINEAVGRVTLWDREFPKVADAPVKVGEFPLAPLFETDATGVPWRVRALQQVQTLSGPQQEVFDDIGNKLLQLLKPSGVLEEWMGRRKPGSRTFVEVRAADMEIEPKLKDLPWEFLAERRSDGIVVRYFTNANSPIFRTHSQSISQQIDEVLPRNALIISGEPLDWAADTFPANDVAAALRQFQVCEKCTHVEVVEAPRLDELTNLIKDLRPHVIHFSGHGETSPHTGLPALKMNVPRDPWWWDSANIHAFLLTLTWRPRLVVINACESAAAAGRFSSVFQVFAENGVPAVVGAQAAIEQAVTARLSEALYAGLLQRKTIDTAIAEARYAIGQSNNGRDWQRRDWGLLVLSLNIVPNELWGQLRQQAPDPVDVVKGCRVLREFMRTDTYTAPFVGLGWPKERRSCLEALQSKHCIIVKGPKSTGKSWLVLRSLRDAIYFGQRVRYVELCSGDTQESFIDLLGAIIAGDPNEVGSELHRSLDNSDFQEFNLLRKNLTRKQINNLSGPQIERICSAFETGLQRAAAQQELTIVLDQFCRDLPTQISFSKDEFRSKLLPYLFIKIAKGAVERVRLVLVVRDDQFADYGLDVLADKPIQLSFFESSSYQKLFYELCRFNRTLKPVGRQDVDLTVVCMYGKILLKNLPSWDASQLVNFKKLVEDVAKP